MTAVYDIRHALDFSYSAPVHGSVATLYVSPAQGRSQILHHLEIETSPRGNMHAFAGPFGNRGHFLDRHAEHDRLAIQVHSRVEVDAPPPLPERLDGGGWGALPDARRLPEISLMTMPSRFARPSAALERFVARHGVAPGDDLLDTVRTLRSTLYRTFTYSPGSTRADSPIDEVLASGKGVCQDYAHVMAAILRGWGVPTRYVSGYLGPPPDSRLPGESHAWVECWLAGAGWRGFDPANDCDCDERHVRVAVGRDYADAPPIRGTFRGAAASTLAVQVSVRRVGPAQEPQPDRRMPGVQGVPHAGSLAGPPAQRQTQDTQQQPQHQTRSYAR